MSAPTIPGFAFVEHLGSGGFADVFLYEQQWPRQRVAVKVVRPDVPLTDREKYLFTAEANAMARLADHPYIVSVITAGVTAEGGRPFLVMRYCPPPDLGVRVRANPMAPVDAVSTGIKLASAIETAHRSGILHRDIKPSNVLVTSYHEPALTDFGIAGHIADVEGDNDVRISYPWSPPELLDGRSNGSVASDVYSLGATIWHLLVGRSPFSIPSGDNSTRALSARILHAPAPATQRPDVPPALDRLLQQCLAKRPDHRPSSALELARALQRIEAAAGWPRTPVAVEGDRPDSSVSTAPAVGAAGGAVGYAGDTDDATAMKPVTVISASGPRRIAAQVPAPVSDDQDEQRGRVPALVWAGAGAAVLAVVLALLVFGGDDRGEDPGVVVPTASQTPADVVPDVITEAVTLNGTRTPRGVLFEWRPPVPVEPGDSFGWHRDDTDEYGTTTRRRLLVRTDDPVCLDVRMTRGSDNSPSASACVS
ncbi:serine/threonine-protein kinase [Nocardioides sp. zg-1228]|uniref:serine/threonine-protein kinase n=1 Tax=Nocardioides sp. zg-1228 TaxID=2763008 RepID=UPI001642DCD7|nr:serine/threonine-protein kinase [Nocardioides sp. zg-1228]MBC2934855.1 serine/threonine protein kinase [Nocardioides sp. zg-1228]QSF58355.1 serine/threonine protein kinase [Nocardioides sp. zg-1228]